MAAQKSVHPYSEPWADEVRAKLQRIAGGEHYVANVGGNDSCELAKNAIAVLDEFIAETPGLLALLPTGAHIDTRGAYPRLSVNGKFLYAAWSGSFQNQVRSALMPLPLHFAPSITAHAWPHCCGSMVRRIMVSTLMRKVWATLRCDPTWSSASFCEKIHAPHLAYILAPTLQHILPERRYVRSPTTGELVEVSAETEVEIAPAQ